MEVFPGAIFCLYNSRSQRFHHKYSELWVEDIENKAWQGLPCVEKQLLLRWPSVGQERGNKAQEMVHF